MRKLLALLIVIFSQQNLAKTPTTVDEIKIQFQGVSARNQTPTSRNINLKFSTCLGLPDSEVAVTPGNQKLKTDAKGCIQWTSQYRHKVYEPNQDQLQFISITILKSNEKINIPIFINPFRNDADFAVDGRFIDKDRKNTKPQPAPFIQIPSVQAQFSGTDFKVDSLLEVTFVRRYSLALTPEVVRPDLQSISMSAPERLRDGKYILRASLFLGDENIAKSQIPKFVDSYQKVVEVQGGRIQTQIEFSSNDLIVWGGRNSVAFEIYPLGADGKSLDLNSGLQQRVFWGSFTPSNEMSNIIIAKVESEADSQTKFSKFLSENSKKLIAQRVRKQYNFSLKAFIEENGLTLVSAQDAAFASYGVNEEFIMDLALQGSINVDRNSLNKNLRPLCRAFFIDNLGISKSQSADFYKAAKTTKACEKNPLSVFTIEHRIHNLDNAPTVQWLGGASQSFNVANSFDLGSGRSLGSTLRQGASSQVGASLRPLSLLTNTLSKVPLLKDFFSASLDWSWSLDSSRTDTISDSNGQTVNFSRGLYLIEQQAVLEISIQKYQPCISVLVNEQALLSIYDDIPPVNRPQGFHFCAPRQTNGITFLENYFFFSQHFSTGDFIDARHPNNRPFVLSIRGNRDYYTFLNLTHSLLSLNNAGQTVKANPSDLYIKGADLFSQQQRAYPGSTSAFTDAQQIEFMLQSETSAEAKGVLAKFLQEMSPFSRHQIKPLAAR
ncbi:MAG: hypothetical protein A4S09_11125 [Proteobacteria bacterium SG_bin7]|nr:MAG: hypothetical protein A4S09_11125 [Proteobacteria bacterium SG_bin7]